MATNDDIWDAFSEKKPTRGLGLKVEKKVFWVSREALAEYSPVFAGKFYGQAQDAQKEIVTLPKKKAVEILEMLRCLFRTEAKIKKIDMQNVEILLKLANEYEIKYLFVKCEKFLIKSMASATSKTIMLQLFVIGVEYKMKKIVRGLFPEVRRMDSQTVQSALAKSPAGIRKALLMPPPTAELDDDEHDFESEKIGDGARCGCGADADFECCLCGYTMCAEHDESYIDVKCTGCNGCKNKNPRNGKREKNCQCITKTAIKELEKMGL